jgi:virginiamycin B lyase
MRQGSLFAFVAVFLCSVLSAQAQGRQDQQTPLPDGKGREMVQATCTRCHGLNLITNSGGYTREGWEHVFSSMVAVPRKQAAVLADYLAESFQVKPRPAAVLIPRSTTVSIREWVVPSLGSRPHDPFAAADGSIWWTGQWANVLGRLDPKTGAMREYPLKTPESGPHGLVADRTGNIWYTGIAKGHVGKLDPSTGEVTEYPLADANARGPHTPIFD